VDLDTAAVTLFGGLTGQLLVSKAYDVKKGDWILVHAAAGATGVILGQLLRARGARTIGTVSSSAKTSIAKDAGYEVVIESYEYDVVLEKVMQVTQNKGVAAVYDGVYSPDLRC